MKKNLYIASVSGGKDSVATVDRLIKDGWPLDMVVFYDGGMEFKAVYNVIEKVKRLCEVNGIQFVKLTPKHSFEYAAFELPINARNGETKIGYSWCGGRCRWATAEKLEAISRFYNSLSDDTFIVEYVGIAADEKDRIWEKRRTRCNGSIKLYPLIEWGMSEAECLQYCHAAGYHWKERDDIPELYTLFDRLSCFCCRNKNLKELRNMYKYLPEYWERLKHMQEKTAFPFYKGKYTIEDLEKRFAVEGIGYNLFDFAESNGFHL